MLSHADTNAVESYWRRCCRGDLAAMRCRCLLMLATMLLSHAGDDAVDTTWPRHDVDAESCWPQCCRVMLAMALQLTGVLAVIRLRSPRARSIEVLTHRE
jgi:hypothetical protein